VEGRASPQLGYIWAAPDPILIIDHGGQIEFVNISALRLLGYTAPELIGQQVKLVLPDLRMPPFGPAVSEQTAWRCDGTSLPAEVTVNQGDHAPAIVVVRDLSDRKRAIAAEARLALVVRSSHEAIIAHDLDGIVTDWNPGATRLYGLRPDEVIGRHSLDLVPEHRRTEEETILVAVGRGQVIDRHRAVRHRKDGTPVQVSITLSPITDDSGEIIGVASISQAVSTEELVDAKIVGVLEAVPDAIVVTDAKGFIVLANAQTTRLLGYSRDELVGQPVEMLVPTDLRRAHVVHRTRYVNNPVNRPIGLGGEQLMAQRKNGTRFPADVSLSSLQTDDGLLVAAAIRDATDRLRTRAEHDRLKTIAEQERLARQLQQNQRLESLGQLAGGVAHDFNNLLAVIVNYAGFVAQEIGDAAGTDPSRWGPVARDIEQLQRAADRGITLTHHLLAFGRREVARPRVITINSVIDDVNRMLGRSLGEHIELRCRLDDGLWPVRVDPAQLEQVLVNLAVNARDAMPRGGTVTFTTENLVLSEPTDVLGPGRYARIRVTDTGAGMPPDVLARAFEPFFTTKPKGEGTGLGLATVYGIVTEAAGEVQVSSWPGRGTTITVLLPATDQPLHSEEKKATGSRPRRLRGHPRRRRPARDPAGAHPHRPAAPAAHRRGDAPGAGQGRGRGDPGGAQRHQGAVHVGLRASGVGRDRHGGGRGQPAGEAVLRAEPAGRGARGVRRVTAPAPRPRPTGRAGRASRASRSRPARCPRSRHVRGCVPTRTAPARRRPSRGPARRGRCRARRAC
jgi:PAS domain S-box-containing protein